MALMAKCSDIEYKKNNNNKIKKDTNCGKKIIMKKKKIPRLEVLFFLSYQPFWTQQAIKGYLSFL